MLSERMAFRTHWHQITLQLQPYYTYVHIRVHHVRSVAGLPFGRASPLHSISSRAIFVHFLFAFGVVVVVAATADMLPL